MSYTGNYNSSRPTGYGSYSRPTGYGSYSRPTGYGSYSRPTGYGSYSRPNGYGSYSRPAGNFLQRSDYNNNNTSEESLCQECVVSHIQEGENYKWLEKLGYGKVMEVKFQEPAGEGAWVTYDEKWWEVHCKSISHDPTDNENGLYPSHMAAFVNPGHSINLLFYFTDGCVVSPTSEFYELEEDYFSSHNYCSGKRGERSRERY
jgi:hypothetical protein